MNKKILAIYYSQTGQLAEMIDRFCEPFLQAGNSVEKVRVELKNNYPFPWTAKSFFSVMPDCQLGVPTEIVPFSLQEEKYDLIVLGWQPWFLSPSIPFNSFLQNPSLQKVLKNTSVITVTGCRNMWVNAFERVKKLLKNSEANHVATIALADRHLNLISFFTIFHWLLHGKKDKYLNIFPKPGVADEDIERINFFGEIALQYLQKNDWKTLTEELYKEDGIFLKFHLIFMERKAGAMFRVWARIISKRKNKTLWLRLFKYYLIIALFIFAPIVYVIDLLIFKPFFSKYIQLQKQSILKLS
ncbi:MAG: hypothetical protein PW786_07680 [Arachidicoccus sp.]|nr:hypothetical protein [Arachidicoccus sp.]